MPPIKLSDITIAQPFTYGPELFELGDEERFRDIVRTADLPGLVTQGVIAVAGAPQFSDVLREFTSYGTTDLEALAKGRGLAVVGTGDDGRVRRIDVLEALHRAGVRAPGAEPEAAASTPSAAPASDAALADADKPTPRGRKGAGETTPAGAAD